jgi:hypothetical protein
MSVEGTLEFFGALIGLGLLGLFVILPIVALVRSRRAARLAQQNQDNWQKLTQRVHTLETQVLRLIQRGKEDTESQEKAIHELRAALAAREGPGTTKPALPEPAAPRRRDCTSAAATYCTAERAASCVPGDATSAARRHGATVRIQASRTRRSTVHPAPCATAL